MNKKKLEYIELSTIYISHANTWNFTISFYKFAYVDIIMSFHYLLSMWVHVTILFYKVCVGGQKFGPH